MKKTLDSTTPLVPNHCDPLMAANSTSQLGSVDLTCEKLTQVIVTKPTNHIDTIQSCVIASLKTQILWSNYPEIRNWQQQGFHFQTYKINNEAEFDRLLYAAGLHQLQYLKGESGGAIAYAFEPLYPSAFPREIRSLSTKFHQDPFASSLADLKDNQFPTIEFEPHLPTPEAIITALGNTPRWLDDLGKTNRLNWLNYQNIEALPTKEQP